MRKILLVGALVVGLCLSTVVGNCAVWEDTDTMIVAGNTGHAELTVQQVTLHFEDIQPGERLAVAWWIRNDGPCPLDVKVSLTVTGAPKNYLFPEFKPGLSFSMGPSLKKQVVLLVTMGQFTPDSTADRDFWVTVVFKSKAHGTRQENLGSFNY